MSYPETEMWWLIVMGGVVMALAFLRGMGSCSYVMAEDLVMQRRAAEEETRQAKAEAEAAGRAASIEPLNVNPDGTIEEPIIGLVERE